MIFNNEHYFLGYQTNFKMYDKMTTLPSFKKMNEIVSCK